MSELEEEIDVFNLKDDLKVIAIKIAGKLRSSRMSGSVTPLKPILGREICERLKASDNITINDIQLRKIINWLRGTHHPIATGHRGRGYYWALRHEELDYTRKSLKARRNAIDWAMVGLDAAQFQEVMKINIPIQKSVTSEVSNKLEKPNQEHSTISALVDQLECIPAMG